jgi:hypothetical protein
MDAGSLQKLRTALGGYQQDPNAIRN